MALRYPQRNAEYTISEICHDLMLKDSPYLRVYLPSVEIYSFEPDAVIQDSHITQEELAQRLEGLSFKYILTTDEWIPVFNCVNTEEEILAKIDLDVSLDPHNKSHEGGDFVNLFVVPKGTVFEQFYRPGPTPGTYVHSMMAEGESPIAMPQAIAEAYSALALFKESRGK